MAECFKQLESNNLTLVAEAKEKLNEQFRLTNEPWLLNGLYEYYLQTNSSRVIEVLVNVREPHWTILFDRINESINMKNTKTDSKVKALTLLGHVIRRHPTWLYNITDHQVFKNLIKLLKLETEILPLISALLALVVLLPIIPFKMAQYLSDLFEIFSRLAAWNCSNTGNIIEEQMFHMQVALYSLFQRLYGMYPCHFLGYLRNLYKNRDFTPIFTHTIKPMLMAVKMHPSLVTTNKDYEITAEKWKKMAPHDVIVECEKFSLELIDRCSNESCFFTSSFRSRSNTTNSALHADSSSLHILKSTARFFGNENEFFSPSMVLSPSAPITETTPTNIHIQGSGQRLLSGILLQSQEGTSPPEAAIEATPETTPLRDMRYSPRIPLGSTKAVKALNNFGTKSCSGPSGSNTPTHSQPSSPLRKDSSPFTFPVDPKGTAFYYPRKDSYAQQKLQRVMLERQQSDGDKSRTDIAPPSSPLKFITTYESSSVTSPIPGQRIESPITLEDEEVGFLSKQGEFSKNANLRQCDSVLQDVEETGTEVQIFEEYDLEHGSPCAKGGLHMPNSKSMNEFAKRVRLRYHSQCAPEFERTDDSSSQNNGSSTNAKVRRANSCPEMKKVPCNSTKDSANKQLGVTREESGDNQVDSNSTKKYVSCISTQTDNFWSYEHLFLGIFPSLEYGDIKPSPSPSPAPYNLTQERFTTLSIYETLDRYIEVAVHSSNERDSVKSLKDQLQLMHLQLLFEKHRREIHALKNRRLLADARDMKVLQEHNCALRDQVQLHQKDIDDLRGQLGLFQIQAEAKRKDYLEKLCFWENQCKIAQQECKEVIDKNVDISLELKAAEKKCHEITKSWQDAQALLVDATSEVQIAKEKAYAGERVREALELANREILILGELLIKYKERLADLPSLRQTDYEFEKLTEAYKHEVKGIKNQLEVKSNLAEACRTRITELEQSITQGEELLTTQKKLLNDAKDECHEKLVAAESKYQTQLHINRALESRIFELWQQLDAKRSLQSPDTSSCHEVQPSITEKSVAGGGLSPHSSPLSASLASSEGSVFINPADVKEIRNLQVIADQNDPLNQKVVVREEADPVLLKQYAMAATAAVATPSASTSSAATTSKHD